MNAEMPAEDSLPPSQSAALENKSKTRGKIIWLQSLTFLLGLSLLVFVIYKIGFQTIFDALAQVGWGILLIIALNGARHFLRSLCLYLAVSPAHRKFKYRYALATRLAGESVSFLSFAGPLFGEATKAALLKNRVPLSHGIAAVVIDNILYDISVTLMIIGGSLTMFYIYGSEDRLMQLVLLSAAAGSLLCLAGLAAAFQYRFKPLSYLVKKLAARNRAPGFLIGRQAKIFETEETVQQFYENRKPAFFAISGLILSCHILSVCEVYLALKLLGLAAGPGTSYIIESLTKVINSIFSFVPGTIGVYEGGNSVILHALGYMSAAGLALALVRRSAILFWTTIGFIILLWRGASRGARRLAK